MKLNAIVSLTLALSVSSLALAQSGGMGNMGMKDMDMKGMDHGRSTPSKSSKVKIHQATAVVQAVDMGKGAVTLAHDPVKSLNWPAMTMQFSVKDKALFDKLAVNKKVNVKFVQQGSDYVITSVK